MSWSDIANGRKSIRMASLTIKRGSVLRRLGVQFSKILATKPKSTCSNIQITSWSKTGQNWLMRSPWIRWRGPFLNSTAWNSSSQGTKRRTRLCAGIPSNSKMERNLHYWERSVSRAKVSFCISMFWILWRVSSRRAPSKNILTILISRLL